MAFLALWQCASVWGLVDSRSIPPATAVIARLGEQVQDLEFWRNVGRTMASWGWGLALAVGTGVAGGILVGSNRFLRRATASTVEFLRPIPSVALIPLAIVLYGLQPSAALVIIVYASFWQVFVQTVHGVADIDPVARDTARIFGLAAHTRMLRVVLPGALPFIATGIRLAATVALILAVTAEMTIGVPGLGRALIFAQTAGDYTQLYAIALVTGLLGLAVNLLFRALERRVLGWHESVRNEVVL